MQVEWRNVSVTIEQKRILAPCSGRLQPGRMMALMGPSGSGKSTLLNCLRQVTPHTGEVRFDGAGYSPELRQVIGFSEQDDIVIPALTVKQSLLFLAELRFGVGSSRAYAKVEDVLTQMRLMRVANNIVGTDGSNPRISGGERRRLCIARELLAEPRFLICDEPTSGLDSTMANQVTASMRELCSSGTVTIIAAIHQPSSNIFGRFDDLLLLSEGSVLYTGAASKAEAIFSAVCPPRSPAQSVAEYLMDLLVLGLGSNDEESTSVVMTSEARESLMKTYAEQCAAMPALEKPVAAVGIDPRYAPPFGRQLAVITSRFFILLKGEIFTRTNSIQNILLLLVAALLWVQLGFTEADIFPRWGACLWTAGTWMFFPMFGGLSIIGPYERIIDKELSVGCYSLVALYIARTLLLLPVELVWPTVWTSGLFWISNANPSLWVYVLVILIVLFCFSLFQGVGLAIAVLPMSPASKGTFLIVMITYLFAWTGFFVDLSHLHDGLNWLAEINPFRYVVELMMHVVVHDQVEFTCDGATDSQAYRDESVHCELTENGVYVLSGAQARERLGIRSQRWVCVVIILASMVVSRALAYWLLRRKFWTAVHGAGETRLPAVYTCTSDSKPSFAAKDNSADV